MFYLSGRVIQQESKVGLESLQVVFFDQDDDYEPKCGGAPKRLGSTLTDSTGSFQFELDPAAVDLNGDLELVIHILAPDTAYSEKNPQGKSIEDRTLYRSLHALDRPGSKESFIIELDYLATVDSAPAIDAETLAKNIVAVEQQEISILASTVLPQLEKKNQFRLKSKPIVQALLANSNRPRMNRSSFVPYNADSALIMDELVNEGIQKMESMGSSMEGMVVSLDTLATIDSRFDVSSPNFDAAALPDTVPTAAINEGVMANRPSVKLTKVNDIGQACRKMSMISAMTASVPEPQPALAEPDVHDPSVADESPVLEAPDPSDEIRTWVEDEMGKIRTYAGSSLPSRPTADTLKDTLDRDILGGPADNVAYHDFHALKIAFRNVWTAPLDRELSDQLEKLFEATAQIDEKYGRDGSLQNSGELSDLRELIVSLEAGIRDIESADAAPPEIGNWYPRVAAEWSRLSPMQRVNIRILYWISTITESIAIGGIRIPSPALSFVRVSGSPDLDLYKVEGSIKVSSHTSPFSFLGGPLPLFAAAFTGMSWNPSEKPNYLRERATDILNAITNENVNVNVIGRAKSLITDISEKLRKGYDFDVFKTDTYNFGIVLTYRQRWQPLAYQVGDLAATVPLAPGESRSITKKLVVNTKRAQKEIENAISTRRFESSQTNRADAEIIDRAKASTNFSMTTEGAFSIGIPLISGEGKVGTQFTADQAQESSAIKKDFREAVRKSSSEYRNEHKLEVTTEDSVSIENTSTAKISNPNSEISVTYLFYELQRRYQVSEELYSVAPVILLALDMPEPGEITESWLLEHAWILRRVILDDSFLEPLDFLSDSFTGDEVGTAILKAQWEVQRDLLVDLKRDFETQIVLRNTYRGSFTKAKEQAGVDVGNQGFFENLGESLFGDSSDEARTKASIETYDRLLQWAETEAAGLNDEINAALQGLQQSTKAYVSGLRDQLNRRTAIDSVKLHVKQNVIYYMQAIWAHEPPDQRFFRIYDIPVRAPTAGEECEVLKTTMSTENIVDGRGSLNTKRFIRVRCPSPTAAPARELNEIADLSNLLGFKGNYAVFPLIESNGITDFMIQDYFHEYYGIKDPDPTAKGPSVEDILNYNNCTLDASKAATPTIAGNIDLEAVQEMLNDAVDKGRFATEEIVVPTGQLFIESLPGSHTVLEDFKLRHRAADVMRAHADLRGVELENIRKAARILEGNHEDPDTDRVVVMDSDKTSADVNVDPLVP